MLLVLWQRHEQQQLPMSLKSLGAELHLDSGTLTPLLKRMQKQELLSRVRSDDDERQLQIALTEAGLALQSNAKQWRDTLSQSLQCQREELNAMALQLDALIAELS